MKPPSVLIVDVNRLGVHNSKMKQIAFIVLGLLLSHGAVAKTAKQKPKDSKAVKAQDLLGHYGLDWNKGPGEYQCLKVAEGAPLYAEMKKAKCESKNGAEALSSFSGSYFECFSGPSKHFNWMIFPSEKICNDQIVPLNLPSP